MKKGIELPVNTTIVIALGFIVLVVLAVFLIRIFSQSDLSPENAINMGCRDYALNPADPENPSEISEKLTSIILGDLTGDGLPNNLLDACRIYSKNPSLTPQGCIDICKSRFPGIP
jgi:hypothetical protein